MDKYKVSVIIPVYNAQETIKKCIKSVLKQSLDSIQLIIVNDGSTDDTGNIISNFECKTVKVLNKSNGGVSSARNAGIELSEGKYLFFLDADDNIDFDLLKEMYYFAEENKVDLVACNHIENNSTLYKGNINLSQEFIANSYEEIGEKIFDIFPKSACAKLFRKNIINKNKILFPLDMHLGEDLYFTYTYLLYVNRIGKVCGSFYNIENININSLSKRFVPNIDKDLESQYLLWKKIFKKYPIAEQNYYKIHMQLSISMISSFANNLYKRGCVMSYFEKKKVLKDYLYQHNDWLKDASDFSKRPKNKLEFCTYVVIKSKCIPLICLFFYVKEKIKMKKFRYS